MDLGIAGRKAVVCASSRGLGRGCARALALAGCDVVINGRHADTVDAEVADLQKEVAALPAGHRGAIVGVVADLGTLEGQQALLAACPEPDILVNNNSGPPMRNFRELTREQMLEGLVANMIVAVELTQRVIEPMTRRRFGRIVNITSGTVKMPLAGLDLSSGARAGLTAFFGGVARSVAAANVTINFLLPGAFDTDRLRSTIEAGARKQGVTYDDLAGQRIATIPARRFGQPDEFGAACAFLCSAQAGFITGQSLLIDGGAFPGTF